MLPPAYTTPAPAANSASATVNVTAANVPSIASILEAVAANTNPSATLNLLEHRLVYYSYVGGFQPAVADATVLAAITQHSFGNIDYPNIARWMRSVQSFNTNEIALWC